MSAPSSSSHRHRRPALLRCTAWLAPVWLLALISSAPALLVGGCDDGGGKSDPDTASDVHGGDIAPDGIDPGGNSAPELDKIGNRKAPVGHTLRITANASDADGDALSYSVFGALPEGAKFSKETHTFEWTPAATDNGALVILTFAVSDGSEEDRETIQILVTASAESTPPELQPIGDVFVEINQPLELRLQATDEDGDTLEFSTNNPLPDGATLDSKSGIVRWTPSETQQGSSFRVGFVVSDGDLTDEEEARLLVQTAELKLKKMAPREVALGETLTLSLPIENPLDFKYTCEMLGEAPAGATFDAASCTLSYSPRDPALVNTSTEFVFRVTGSGNGTDYNLIGALTVNILPGDGGAACVPDAHEPNDSESAATTLQPGSHPGLSICGDDDWYQFEVPEGATISVEALFTSVPGGDLELYLYAPTGEEAIAVGDSVTDNESLSFANAAAGTYSLLVYEYGGGQNDYDLSVSVSSESTCTDDTHEPNDSRTSPASLGSGDYHAVDGVLCSGDPDWFSFEAQAGKRLQVVLVFNNSEGDLDLEVYDASGTLVGASRRTTDEELVDLASLATGGTYTAKVVGYQGAQADYLLEINLLGAVQCTADAFEPNNDPGAAAALPSTGSQTVSGLTYCGDADYFRVPLPADLPLEAVLRFTGSAGSLAMHLLDPAGIVSLATAVPDGTGTLRLSFAGDTTARDYVLEVVDAPSGLGYSLELTMGSGGGCDAMSCPLYEVCGDTGACQSDICSSDTDCPSAYRCRQSYCVDACFSDSDCRQASGYACRPLEPSDVVAFCAPSGTGVSGAACQDMADCAGALACLLGTRFPAGMCAQIGCSSDADCDNASTCVEVDSVAICMPFCLANSDCRQAAGYTCQALASVGSSGTAEVCIK